MNPINNSGMSFLETIIAISLTALGALVIVKGFTGTLLVQERSTSQKQAESELTRALGDILRVGRIAQSCAYVPPAPATLRWLECRVDRNIPPTLDPADDTIFRFGMVTGQFQWTRQVGSVFITHQSYDSITHFEVCDDIRMQSTCPISQPGISFRHVANLAAATTLPNRFFRFELKSVGKTTHTIQSAFWVRHPTSVVGFIYQWGQQWNE